MSEAVALQAEVSASLDFVVYNQDFGKALRAVTLFAILAHHQHQSLEAAWSSCRAPTCRMILPACSISYEEHDALIMQPAT